MTDDHPLRNSPSAVMKCRFVGIKIPDLLGRDIITPIVSMFREQLNVCMSDNMFSHIHTLPNLPCLNYYPTKKRMLEKCNCIAKPLKPSVNIF